MVNVTRSGDKYIVSGNFNGTMAELCQKIAESEESAEEIEK